MRRWLVALLLSLCLPLPWAVAAGAPPCAHGPCAAPAVASATATVTATAHLDDPGDLASQHPGCGCCHAGGSLALACAVPALVASPCRVLVSWPVPWQERLWAARPERPQWAALA